MTLAQRRERTSGPWALSTLGNGEAQAVDLGFLTEPPDGIEPSAYALRVGSTSLVRRLVLLLKLMSASAIVRCCSPVWLLAWLLAWLLSQFRVPTAAHRRSWLASRGLVSPGTPSLAALAGLLYPAVMSMDGVPMTVTSDWVTFRLPVRRVLVMTFLIASAWWLVYQTALALILREPPHHPLLALVGGLIGAVVFSGVWLVGHRGRWAWIRMSSTAVELARRGRPVVLAWEAIESATIRRPGPFAALQVTLRPEAVTPPAPAQRPHQRRGRRIYIVDVGLMQPGVQALRAELARHLPQSGT
ncbi:hypothetical protein ACNAW0_27450 [Micromonospora sp. SL1-18]|uniref:hypothetical protein n=1 Tax=Micromonospora sp. SL1-18 TaxID=3399128 RepID=UPI003A4D6C49